MYQRVMVPMDGSEFGEYAIPFALQIAGRMGADVDLVHVHTPAPDDGLSGITPYQFQNAAAHYVEWDRVEFQHDVDRIEEKARALANESGLSVSARVLSGEVLHALLSEAETFHADIIVMATHARTGLQRARFGSVADLVVRNARMPVLLVQPSTVDRWRTAAGTYRRILVPLDGSRYSEAVLESAGDFARSHGAEITLVHVTKQSNSVADEYLERVAASSIALGTETRFETIKAIRVAEGIMEAAERCSADLIALATHGRGGLSRLLVGSTANHVLALTQLPVLLRKPDASDEARVGQAAIVGWFPEV